MLCEMYDLTSGALFEEGAKRIILPDGEAKDAMFAFRVLKVGPGGRRDDGTRNEMPYAPDDIVIPAVDGLVMPLPWDPKRLLVEESCVLAKIGPDGSGDFDNMVDEVASDVVQT